MKGSYQGINYLKNEKLRIKRLEQWYLFLRLSPSYELADQYRKLGYLTAEQKDRLPWSFERVLETYENWGDVWASNFSEWLELNPYIEKDKKKNRHTVAKVGDVDYYIAHDDRYKKFLHKELDDFIDGHWKEVGHPIGVLMMIPTESDKKYVMSEVSKYLDDHKKKIREGDLPPQQIIPIDRFKVLNTRIRENVFNLLQRIIHAKALNPSLTNWQIGVELGLCPEHTEKIMKAENLRAELKQKGNKLSSLDRENDRKLIVSTVVGRHMRNAFLLAENAAHGDFPSFFNEWAMQFKEIKTNFDYDAIKNGLTKIR
jgi:hypothetical protein